MITLKQQATDLKRQAAAELFRVVAQERGRGNDYVRANLDILLKKINKPELILQGMPQGIERALIKADLDIIVDLWEIHESAITIEATLHSMGN